MSKDSRLSIALTFLLKASLPIKGYVSKNVVVSRGEETFNLVKKWIKRMSQTVYSLVCVDLIFVIVVSV